MMENKSMDLGRASIPDKKEFTKEEHVPSKVQADTLFNFVPEFRHLLTYLKNKMISPRYCVEDLEFLGLEKIQKMAYPMKCFCDINMHRLDVHLRWYGYYGVAFSKEWGMHQGIQPCSLTFTTEYFLCDLHTVRGSIRPDKVPAPSGGNQLCNGAVLLRIDLMTYPVSVKNSPRSKRLKNFQYGGFPAAGTARQTD